MKKFICRALTVILSLSLVLTGCSSNKEKDKSKDGKTNSQVTAAVESSSLRQAADKYNILIGAAVEPSYLDEPDYAKVLASQYNFITPENRMKWGFIHPKKDKFDFTGADKIVDFAVKNNMKLRGHTLAWHIENPSWLTDGKWTKEEALAILENHIKTVVGHYKGKIYAWDVVNEVIDAFTLRKNLWLDTIGPEYIEKAFIWAHEADPDAKLYINDFLIEEKGVKSEYLYKIVKELLDKKVPVHGVGLQCHFELANPPDMGRINENIKKFAELGLNVDFTEIDIRIEGLPTKEQLEKQAQIYGDLMNLALVNDKVRVYTMWGLTDKHSWVPDTYPEAGAAHIFDEKYNPKPAYTALLDSLKKGPVEVDYEKLRIEAMKARNIVPPFEAMPASKVPVIDGKVSTDEWKDAVAYPFLYNQLNTNDERPPEDLNDISGDWRIMYSKNKIYGLVNRADNVTKVDQLTEYVNDCVELFTEINGSANQLRTIVGGDWLFNPVEGEKKAVWSKDGKVLEFSIEFPTQQDMAGTLIGWDIALTDSDETGDARKFQLYPINGSNTNFQGKDLAGLKFVGATEAEPNKQYVIPPFVANQALKAPTIDGVEDPGIWDLVAKYKLGYNWLNPKDQTSPKDNKDLYTEWKVIFDKNTIYGFVKRIDDKTVTSHKEASENDNVEVSLRSGGEVTTLRSIVGNDWLGSSYKGKVKAAWSPDGTACEFSIEYPDGGDDLTGKTIGWNISVSDNDGGDTSKRKYQLFPICGAVGGNSQLNYLGELTFVK